MPTLTRSDQSVLGRWWWTVDRWTLAAIALLIGFGILLVQAATPAIAVKHGLDSFYFVERHIGMLALSVIIMFAVSLMQPRQVLTMSALLLAIFIPLLAATLFWGVEIKGATRWVRILGTSVQPSEFVKPLLAVVAGALFARHCERKGFPALGVNFIVYFMIAACLVSQPDIGMMFLTSVIWFGIFFLAGLPPVLVAGCAGMGVVGLFAAYKLFAHFASRLDRFLSNTGDTYQTDRALDAFMNGGLFGTGPGSGSVKMSLPDAHADFIFAVAGEELGFIWCAIIIGLFAFIVIRGLWRLRGEKNLFILLAGSGLLIEFGLQTAINLASTLHLIPAKGMTLPFISYGGSSLLALGLEMGMLLAMTRKRYGLTEV